MTETTNLNLKLLKYNQAQKEIIVNEALVTLDAMLNRVVVKFEVDPEKANQNNDVYIVGNAAQGQWSDKANALTFYFNGWRYIQPRSGWIFWLEEKSEFIKFNGKNWLPLSEVNCDVIK